MGYYVKGFNQQPYKLKVVKTSNPDINDGETKVEAIVSAISYCSKTLKSWKKDKTAHGKAIVKSQTQALKVLAQLLKSEL